jgi:thiamine pyrophosphate-dependent acetolactate synthase large subunit-like protein
MQSEKNHPHGGERIAAALVAEGVPFIFTLCGGHISPILTAAKARGMRVVDCRHEATAVFAADAVARLTGIPGVAVVTAGPGVTNTTTALKNAQLAQSPVVVLGGAAPTILQGRGALQDIDQRSVVAPHVKLYKKVKHVGDLGSSVEEAFAVAREGVRGPVFIECPVDLLYEEATVRKWYADAVGKGSSVKDRLLRWHLDRHLEKMFGGSHARAETRRRPPSAPAPSASRVKSAVKALAKAERPVMVVGSQALALADEADRTAAAVAELGIPVYLSGMARGLLGLEHPLQMRHARRVALRESDCVILAGVPCDFRLDYGRHIRRTTPLISANRSAREARLNRRPTITLIGDPGRFLQQLAGNSRRAEPKWQAWTAKLRERDCAREAEIEARAQVEGEFVNPLRFFRELDRAAGPNAVMVADGGDFVATSSYTVRPRGALAWLDPGVFGTLGVGAGFALGAALARPAAEVWIIFGDGASGYGLVEFDTFVRHGIPVIGIIGNDASWSQIAREQVKLLSDDVGTALLRTDYHKVAESFGAAGLLVEKNSGVSETLTNAREIAKSGKPVLVNVWIDKTDFREGSISM